MSNAIVQRNYLPRVLADHRSRLRALELSDGSNHWINVANDDTDPLWTPESPRWENGWGNTGGGQAPVSFKMFLNWVHIRGSFTGGADGTVVFTLPLHYRPLYVQAAVGPLADGSGVFSYIVGVDGTVTYVTSGAL